MSGDSSVGNAAVYEAGDQRNASDAQKQEDQPERFEEGKENAHKENDSSQWIFLLFPTTSPLSKLLSLVIMAFTTDTPTSKQRTSAA